MANNETQVAAAIEGLLHPDVWAMLPEIITELKQSTGEKWAVGDVIERLYAILDAQGAEIDLAPGAAGTAATSGAGDPGKEE